MIQVGVFDSGIGGLSVAKAIEQTLPEVTVTYATDSEHLPYGDKTPEQLLGFMVPILQRLVDQDCRVIVIACNTATTTIIEELRARLPVPLIGIEPMVRPAAEQTKSGVIAVCATPGTLHSKRYAWLKDTYAKGIKVIEPDCSQWAYMIENDRVNQARIASQITEVCRQGADVIVLGCTHYHWIEEVIAKATKNRAQVMQPEPAVVRQLKKIIAGL